MKNQSWINQCNLWKDKWKVSPTGSKLISGIDIYDIASCLNKLIKADDIIMVDTGSPMYVMPVALECVESNQFIFSPSQAELGWALPASIGVSISSKKNVIAIIGDGSFMGNIQELSVVKEHNLPIKFLLLNNNGYMTIKNTQSKYHANSVWGVNNRTGLSFPNFESIATAFEIDYAIIDNIKDLYDDFYTYIHSDTSMIIEIICKEDQEILPAQSFKIDDNGNKIQAPLHDMFPFLQECQAEWKNLK